MNETAFSPSSSKGGEPADGSLSCTPPRAIENIPARWSEPIGLLLLAALCLLPLLVERGAVEFVNPYSFPIVTWLAKIAIVSGMGLAIGLSAWWSRPGETWSVPCLL